MVLPIVGLVFYHQLIINLPSDMPIGQPNVDNLSMRLSSQMTLGCVKLKIKANHHSGFYIAQCLYSILRQSYSFIKHLVEGQSEGSDGDRKRAEAVCNYSTIFKEEGIKYDEKPFWISLS